MSVSKNIRKLNVLFIDNFDSFVFNLVDEFKKRECNVQVWRNDISAEKALEIVDKMVGPKLIVLSPGPGIPSNAGCCIDLIKTAPANLPIFGVCLGHQAIVEALGGQVIQAEEIVHGKSSMIDCMEDSPIFKECSNPLSIGRYHSLVTRPDEGNLKIVATCGEMVMAVEHIQRKVIGVQFHPESILTPEGGKIVGNMIEWAKGTV